MDKVFIAFFLTILGSAEGQAATQQNRSIEGKTIQQKDVDLDELHARHPEANVKSCNPYARDCRTNTKLPKFNTIKK